MEFKVEDIVYFNFEATSPEDGKRYVYQAIGQIGHISEDKVWYEIHISLKANFELTANDLPAENRPVVLELDEVPPGTPNAIQIVRVRRKNILKFIPSKKDSFSLIHSVRTPCLRGKLVQAWTIRADGSRQFAIGKVISDGYRSGPRNQACRIVLEGKVEGAFLQYQVSPGVIEFAEREEDLYKPCGCGLVIAPIAEEDRTNVDKFRAAYLDYLQKIVYVNFKDMKRETVSAVMSGFAFTRENSFLGGQDEITQLELSVERSFLSWKRSGIANVLEKGDIIYGYERPMDGKSRARHKRNSLFWLNASRYPGLDGFIQFLQNASAPGGIEKFKPSSVQTKTGGETIFSNLLHGYFYPTATHNQHFVWIVKNVFWYYKL